jgi:hypothetical protein
MRSLTRSLRYGWLLLAGACVVSCGGWGGGTIASSSSGSGTTVTSAANVLPVIVDAGPNNNSANTLFASVTICVPGSTTQCQTIDHVQVDTGSYGFRVLSSVLTLSLPVTMASDGNSLVECTQFVDGYSWGPVASADLQVGGESASSVPVQVIGSSSFATVPSACSSTGPAEDTVMQFGANGILGVGVFEQDCGSGCAVSATPGYYYSCTTTACNAIIVPLTSQVQNPISLFATDNNGSIIVLPSVAAAGATTLSGSLIFGIDTESNNASGAETVLTLDGNGDFTTTFNSASLNTSFIDSGSNGLYFDDSSITVCTNTNFTGFYCPAGTLSFTATLTGAGTAPATTTATFSVADAETLNGTYTVLPELAGQFTTSGTSMTSSATTFDWGLPFFYGRRVANALENHHTSLASGPYVAF